MLTKWATPPPSAPFLLALVEKMVARSVFSCGLFLPFCHHISNDHGVLRGGLRSATVRTALWLPLFVQRDLYSKQPELHGDANL